MTTKALWVPAPPPGFVLRPVPDAPATDLPKAKLGFDPARIVAKAPAKAAA